MEFSQSSPEDAKKSSKMSKIIKSAKYKGCDKDK